MKSIRITILIDNQAGPGLVAEHGFSLWIEAGGKRIDFVKTAKELTAEIKALGPNEIKNKMLL